MYWFGWLAVGVILGTTAVHVWRTAPFKRKKTFDIGGVEEGLDEYAMQERAECIERIVESGKSLEEATTLADSWFIMTVQEKIGDEPMKTRYVPCPMWDWDWGWRAMFDTHKEAVAYIESKSGRRLE